MFVELELTDGDGVLADLFATRVEVTDGDDGVLADLFAAGVEVTDGDDGVLADLFAAGVEVTDGDDGALFVGVDVTYWVDKTLTGVVLEDVTSMDCSDGALKCDCRVLTD